MIPAVAILIFAWSLKGMGDALGIGVFVENLVGTNASASVILPAVMFMIAIFLAFSTGTSWGTFAILVPIVVAMFPGQKNLEMMIISVAAVLAGAVCGDHISPISDTTVMSSAGAQSNHINHVSTQMQYAMVVAAVCIVGDLIAVIVKIWWAALGSSRLILFAVLTVLNDIGAKVADGAKLSVIHLFLGGDRVYNGCKAELIGKKSNFTADIAYTVADDCVLDMNYVALHEGRKSVSEIRTDGVLHENARKLFRGTIDFKKGAAGAVGNEKEDVLLLDDDVVNQTIPLILCAEEDVEGNHGATIGKLDEDLVFYLESRGMALAEIYKMMAKARIDAVLRFVPDEKTKADVASYLESEGSNGCE